MCPERTDEAVNTITGANNWDLTFRRQGNGVILLRCRTCDAAAALPETVAGIPVTALGDRALSPEGPEVEGERIRITCGPNPGVPWDNRRLQSLTLPPTLDRVGHFALYHCRALQHLRLWDGVSFWGDGVLTNCPLARIELEQAQGDGGAMAYFAGELSRELDISVLRDSTTVLRLIFPGYREIYEENSPAHHFDYTIQGAGYPYHHCFRQRKLELIEYDRLWGKTKILETETALRLAWMRLRYPEGLTDWARRAYEDSLRSHAQAAAEWLIRSGDVSGLAFLLDRVKLDGTALSGALSLARDHRLTGAAALLLEQTRTRPPAADRFAL